jgi:uncharacterized membrane protein YfcA
MSHLLLMTLYAFLVSLFFAVLWRYEAKDRVRLFLQIFLGMMLGAFALGWLMYPFPSGPPAPIP